jgi:hypothetical protein
MRPIAVLFASALACLTANETRAQAPIDRAAWLAGCWQRQTTNRVVDEQWMAPAGGVMLGMGRTVIDGALREFEYVRISDVNGALVYHAEPSGQKPADFKSKSVTDQELVFEDLTHDFPQRVRYRRVTADSMVARIEGSMNGKDRAVDFPFVRVKCPCGRRTAV